MSQLLFKITGILTHELIALLLHLLYMWKWHIALVLNLLLSAFTFHFFL